MPRRFFLKFKLMRKVKRVKSQPVFHPFEPGPEIVKKLPRFRPSMVKNMVKASPILRFSMAKRIAKLTPVFLVFQAKILVKTPPVFIVKRPRVMPVFMVMRSPVIPVFMVKVKNGKTSAVFIVLKVKKLVKMPISHSHHPRKQSSSIAYLTASMLWSLPSGISSTHVPSASRMYSLSVNSS